MIFLKFKINEIVLKKHIFGKIENRNISLSSDCREMKHSSLDSSYHDESNGGDFILLSKMEAEIFNENCIEKFTNLIHIESDYIQIQIRLNLIIFEFRSVQFKFYSNSNQIRF